MAKMRYALWNELKENGSSLWKGPWIREKSHWSWGKVLSQKTIAYLEMTINKMYSLLGQWSQNNQPYPNRICRSLRSRWFSMMSLCRGWHLTILDHQLSLRVGWKRISRSQIWVNISLNAKNSSKIKKSSLEVKMSNLLLSLNNLLTLL